MSTTRTMPEDIRDGLLAPFRDRFQAALAASMADHLDRLTWDRTRIETLQRDRLRALLRIAVERSAFHARRLRGVDPDTFELADLPRVPVMTKAEMMNAFDDVVTDRRLSRAVADDAISATTTVPRPIAGELIVLASGGSSGTRGLFAFDVDTFAEYAASLVRLAVARQAAAGPDGRGNGPTVIVAASSAIHATGAAPPLLAGTPMEFIPVAATRPVEDIVARLDELQPGVLYGYPSLLAVLAGEQLAGRLHISPRSVTAHSETLQEAHRTLISDAFSVPVANSYGTTEGLVGASPPGHHTLTFASDCCITELVDEADQPVPPGTTSAAVLVTNLFNTVQPLIRYRLEDRLTRQPDDDLHGHLRADVQGRAATVFHYADVAVHPLVIATTLTRHPHVVDYQARQTDRGVSVEVVVTRPIDTATLTADLTNALADVGLTRPTVHVQVVPALARDARTGKLNQFVPLHIVTTGINIVR
jgi:phenylacetate-coenzyme A ligase PaaK-like adenylate-forming protein